MTTFFEIGMIQHMSYRNIKHVIFLAVWIILKYLQRLTTCIIVLQYVMWLAINTLTKPIVAIINMLGGLGIVNQ